MSSAVELLKVVVKTGRPELLSSFLKSCDDSRLFCQSKEAVPAVALTNRLLNENSSRREGLIILKCLILQLPAEELQANFISWLQQTLRGLSQKESASTVILSAEVMSTLISLSTKFVDIRKEVALTLSKKFLEVLFELRGSPDFVRPVLTTLQSLLDNYGKGVTSWKDKIDQYLFSLVEEDKQTVFLASICYLWLAKCGIPGTDNVLYKEAWTNQFSSLTSSLHHILNRLFVNFNEIEQFGRDKNSGLSTQLPEINEKIKFTKIYRLTSQFQGLVQFLETMLLGPFPVPKRVLPDSVFGVICRGLAVTISTLQTQVTSDTEALISQIPRLHSACLSLLAALIKSCRINLVSHGPIICKLISQVLKHSGVSEPVYGQHKPHRLVRKAAYNCLLSWLSIANCSSSIEKHPEVIDAIVSDIQFKRPTVTLNLSSKMLKGKMGKKQRQLLIKSTTVDKAEPHVINSTSNKEVCSAALQTIPMLMESAAVFLPPETHQKLQMVICNELQTTQLNSGDNVPLPYSDNSCRLELYKSFAALCHHSHPSFPPPITMASQLISEGLFDPYDEIVHFCTLTLSTLDKILRPIGPTISVPIDLPSSIFKTNQVNFGIPLSHTENEGVSAKNNDIDLSPKLVNTLSGDVRGTENPRSPVNSGLEDPMLVDTEMSEFDYSDSIKDGPLAAVAKLIDPPDKDCPDTKPEEEIEKCGKPNEIEESHSNDTKRKTDTEGNFESKRIKREEPPEERHSEVSSTINFPSSSKKPSDQDVEDIEASASSPQESETASKSPSLSSIPVPNGLEVEGAQKDVNESKNTDDNTDDLEAEMLNSFVDDV